MTNKKSNQRTNNISEALENVFKFALNVGKPIVVESIQDVKTNNLYGNKKANRKISQFAYDKMDALIEHKSQKYGICVRKVNPAYTSQIGKLKYMKQAGLSVHEAAAYTIARRGMGFKERIPNQLRHFIPKNKRKAHHWAQWNKISSTLKTIPTHLFYNKKISYVKFKTLTKLKKTLMGGLAS